MSLPEKTAARTPKVLLAGSALYLFLNLFATPRVPFLLAGDQMYFWMDAMRLLDGRHIYQDFLQFSPPGTDLVYLGLFRLFGLRVWVTNLAVLGLGLAFVWLIVSIALRIMPYRSAVLAAVVFLVPVYSKALNATHHWFGVLAVLAAVRVLMPGCTGIRIVLAGALLGLSSFFSLYHGAVSLLAFAVFLLWNRRRRSLALLFPGYLAALAALSSPYLATNGIRQLWYCQVTFVWQFAAHTQQNLPLGLPLTITLHHLPALAPYLAIYLLLPASSIAALYLCWRHRSSASRPVALLALVALSLFAEIAVSPNWLRLYAVSAPAVVVLLWVIQRLGRLRLCASIALWVWIVLFGASQIGLRHATPRAVLTVPAGTIATTPATAARLTLLSQFTQPGDTVLQAAWPGVYLPLQVRNPMYADTASSADMLRPGDVQLAARQLTEMRARYVLWTPLLDSPCLPACSDRLTPLRDALHAAYLPGASLPEGEMLWRRRDVAPMQVDLRP